MNLTGILIGRGIDMAVLPVVLLGMLLLFFATVQPHSGKPL